jgi:hypothetical protein
MSDGQLKNSPTELTLQSRRAVAGEGEYAYEWRNKPHKTVYRLCAAIEADAEAIQRLTKERDGAFAAGAKQMRERAAAVLLEDFGEHYADLIRNLPLEESK